VQEQTNHFEEGEVAASNPPLLSGREEMEKRRHEESSHGCVYVASCSSASPKCLSRTTHVRPRVAPLANQEEDERICMRAGVFRAENETGGFAN